MWLHASTIALSAFLLFLVQPIIAKMILPWFGGAAGVWTVCMVFFQVTLLAGYGYAHLLASRRPPRTQAVLHLALLSASLLCLPIVPSAALKPAGGTDAPTSILLLLAATIGLPYFLLASTGPLLQSWIAPRYPAATVYRMFALSNAGSLLGLLAYPFAIEPFATSGLQARGWSIGYAAFALACGVVAWHRRADAAPALPAPPPARAAAVLAWLGLSALGVGLLLSTTSHLAQNVASVPFLWVLPLTLYLLTFVLAFEGRGGRGWYDPRWGRPLAVAWAVLMAAGLGAHGGVLDIGLAVPLYCFGLFFTCLFCHGELAARKPEAGALTRYYLVISLGGALGGVAVGLVAPRVLDALLEFPAALLAVCLAALAGGARTLARGWRRGLAAAAATGALAVAWFGGSYLEFLRHDLIDMKRNFYGSLRVRVVGSGDQEVRRLLHGVILHGEQATGAPDRDRPGSYYVPSSGVGRAILAAQARKPALRLGVVGLGVGTLAGYGRAGDELRFYEIDPDVVALARRDFSYLGDCPGKVEIVLGDARLSLERELDAGRPQAFDVLAIDAFAGDSIPVHLLTREAVSLYMRHLADGGVLAVHISNRFLDLGPVLANIAADAGLQARLVDDQPPEDDARASSSDWVLLARAPGPLDAAPAGERGEALAPVPGLGLWSDQFNNLLAVLKTSPLRALGALWPGAGA